MKLIYILPAFLLIFSGCTSSDIQRVLDSVNSSTALSSAEVAKGLKEALKIGIEKGSNKLSITDGYYKSAYKILLPDEARIVAEKLSLIPGFSNLEDKIVEKINRAAEDAAKSAAPIFKDAITSMSIGDAWDILKGVDNAATSYLHLKTNDQLYGKFNPVIVSSLNKFGALDLWTNAVTKYNKIPFVEKLNPSLDDYVTNKALDGLFDMVAKEEKEIRTNVSSRVTDLLKRVFAQQD